MQDLVAKLEVEIPTEHQRKRGKNHYSLVETHSLSLLHFNYKMKLGLSYIKKEFYIFYAKH